MSKALSVLMGVLLLFGVVIIVGCGSDDDTTSSGGSGTYIHIPFPEGTYFARVRSVEVTATGSGITTPVTAKDTTIVGTAQTDISLSVPAGNDRHFDIIASDSLGQNLYRAQLEATVGSGRTDLSAMLMPAGYGTPTKVKLFRDEIPWSAYGAPTDSVLIYAGFTAGSGTNQYQILSSSLMGSITFTPGTDLVIFESNQDSVFYTNYGNAHATFENFVAEGGVLFFMAASQGSSEPERSILLPDSVTYTHSLSTNNYAKTSDHPMSANLDSVLSWNFGSHGYFSDLASGSLTLYVDSADSATVVIYNYGNGTVVASGQPIEFFRHLNEPSINTILSQTVRFLLGLDPTSEPHPRRGDGDKAFSSITAR